MKNDPSIKLSRRRFVGGVIATAATATAMQTCAASPAEAASPETSPGWIDAHVHVWTPDTDKYPISPQFSKSDMLPNSFTDEQLFSHCRPAGVERVVLIQMSFYQYDHSYMLDVMKANPGVFSGVALIDHHRPDLGKQMQSLAQKGMRGFRLHSRGDAKDWVDDPGMQKLWRTAADEGLAVCPLINPGDIQYVDALCKRFPETTVVVDHFARIGVSGKIEQDSLDQLCRLARFPNAHVKTSAFYALGKKQPPYVDLIPMIKQVTEHFGPERLMWASDCPFQVEDGHTYDASIALIRDRIDFLSASDKQWLLKGTAEKVFFA
ncbi:amidohydrolase family protein [Novipirellula sp. SH528]|uniref:amidohydrolase family protein n=1 Tax=Novipirellula sp. SH528 TaxID=3454466 RepID=UPI003F9F82D7